MPMDAGSDVVRLSFGSSSKKQEAFRIGLEALYINAVADATTTRSSGSPRPPVSFTFKLKRTCSTSDHASLRSMFPVTRADADNDNDSSDSDATYHLFASDYWQHIHCLARNACHVTSHVAQRMVVAPTSRITHPWRPPVPSSTLLYQRRIASLSHSRFTLRVVDVDRDLVRYAAWQDSERVNHFWGERGSDHAATLVRQLQDAHVVPAIASWEDDDDDGDDKDDDDGDDKDDDDGDDKDDDDKDGRFGYFELYWAKEDAIASHADAQNYDAGFHALVGEQRFRGAHRVKVWIHCITHYLFLRDARTQRVMLEPRVDNVTFITYLQQAGFVVEKEFNFPHKRAALLSITREKFFESGPGLAM